RIIDIDDKFKQLNIFNIKIAIKKQYYKLFFKHKVRQNSILIVEINNGHGETIPSFINYFYNLNYNIDIIVNYDMVRDKVLDRFNFENINLFYMTFDEINKVLQNNIITKYKYLFFNSFCFYKDNKAFHIFEINKKISMPIERIIGVEHNIDNLKLLKKNTITLLPNSSKCKWVNPHYFGEKKLKSKNRDIIKFLLTAREANSAKNLDLLIDSIRDVIKSGINNFKVIFTGRIANLNININDIKDNVEFTGYLDYVQLYKYCEDADFILPMLDPNIESHKRFFEDVSGSFQLVYGFGIVPIVHKAFSLRYGLDSDNSLVYNNYDEFIQKFKYAVNMSDWEYKSKAKNILDYSDKLYKESLENIKSILKD
ncbi:hypothetical protein, partial [uncultured Brachyspira sp.]|uniref:hypothetical protein n=1 Tax=uncultured Brachyspira sp. TaxID=221953 RepID=UPI00261BF6D7